jgi:YrbI family 3-deoxy-D-manno-octulosonate 8-phosphate phosphatase
MSIKFVVFDFDGVFSDKIYISSEGIITKSVNPKDTYSLQLLKNKNIKIGIITACSTNVIDNIDKITSRIDFLSKGNYDKLSVIKTWMNELNINFENVAYIGDDIFDIPVIKNVGFSACPADAVNECLSTVNFVCKNKSGDGAVREFVSKILEMNNNYVQQEEYDFSHIKENGKITAIIPVRSGSTRCKNKNIRDFGDTNLLKRKIEILKQVDEIDEILVSSNCDKMLQIALDLGVSIHKRDQKYCSTECSGKQVFCELANNIKNEIMLYTQCVSPFITIKCYKNCIHEWINNNSNDSINTVNNSQDFLWYNNNPINYDYNNAPQSQLLPIYHIPNFGINIIKTKDVLKYKNIIGKNPKFIESSPVNGIDIDHPHEFVISELLYNNNIESNEDAENLLKRRDCYEKPEMLDCTIRDGGYLNNWEFTDDEVLECYKSVSDAGYKYFEIGFKSNEKLTKGKGKWYYSREEDILNVKSKYVDGCKISVLATQGLFLESDFLEKTKSNIDLIRVLLKKTSKKEGFLYSEEDVKEVVVITNNLVQKGYEIALNIMAADKISDNEIDFICKHVCDVKLKALYLADTYGSFNEKNLPIILNKFQRKLNKYNPSNSIVFGFHIHNNNEDALIKYKYSKYLGVGLIDSCICGLGRGAGNLQTEQVLLSNINEPVNEKILWGILSVGSKLCKYNDYLNEKCYFNKFFYALSGALSLHPDYVKQLMDYDTISYKNKYDIIFKLNDYVKENKEFNYNKQIIDYFV